MKYGKTIGGTLQEKENQSTIMTHEAYLRPLIPLQSEIKILKCSSSVSYKTNKLLPRSVQQFMRLTDCRTNVAAPQSELSAPKIGQFTKNICCPPACRAAMSRTARPVTVPGPGGGDTEAGL